MRVRSVLERRGNLEIAMTPMIDVVFMLMIFFVWTSSFQVPEMSLPSGLISPESAGTNATVVEETFDDLERIVVRVFDQGNDVAWTVNDVPVSNLMQLEQRLRIVGRIKPALPVVVDPDPSISIGDAIDVYDIARIAGFQQVNFSVPITP